jgi:hypothetical protein
MEKRMVFRAAAVSVLCLMIGLSGTASGFASSKTVKIINPVRASGIKLTKAECEGLGGKVFAAPNRCEASQLVCATTNPDGVVHLKCVDKVK